MPACQQDSADLLGQLTDLRLDVSPLSRRVELDQLVVQLLSHGNDSVSHSLDLAEPDVSGIREMLVTLTTPCSGSRRREWR